MLADSFLKPGTTMRYNGTSDGDPTQDIFAVTNETKEILGIPTRVIHDDRYVKDKHEETTNDWFAQDDQGMSGIWENLQQTLVIRKVMKVLGKPL
jgi:hypothetical protein